VIKLRSDKTEKERKYVWITNHAWKRFSNSPGSNYMKLHLM